MLSRSFLVLTSSRTPLPSAYFRALSMMFKTESVKPLSCAARTAFSPSANEARKYLLHGVMYGTVRFFYFNWSPHP